MYTNEERLDEVIEMLESLPIMSSDSSREPMVKFRMIDITKLIEVAKGQTKPSDWVSEPCENVVRFEHLPHHYSEYREGEEPLRVPHYCSGVAA